MARVKAAPAREGSVAAYKTVLKRVVDNRPSGTRHRLANLLGKNRSFISQITNPVYAVPIPALHLDSIFEVCHFTPAERREFLAAYADAHPRRLELVKQQAGHMRELTLTLPDLGDTRRNAKLDEAIVEMARHLARFAQQE